MPLMQGEILNNRYRIVKLLGQGGFGAVYKAWDLNFEVSCAVKENFDYTFEAQRQFLREARLLHVLRHTNLPLVKDCFVIQNQGQYLVMDYVEGQDLEEMRISSGGRLKESQVIPWIGQVCDAIAYLHGQNPPVIHRDIKPANIKITSTNKAVLVDFGIAKTYDPTQKTTMGARAVTPGYSPLEQYGTGMTDSRTDIYAIGATLYTLLVGQEPLESPTRAVNDTLLSPRQINATVSTQAELAIMRAMQLDPGKRFQSIGEFKSAILTPTPQRSATMTVGFPATRANFPFQPVQNIAKPLRNPIGTIATHRFYHWRTIKVNGEVEGLSWSPDGRGFAICNKLGYAIYDTNSLTMKQNVDCNAKVYCIAFSPDGMQVAVGRWDGKIELRNVLDGRLIRKFETHEKLVWSIAFSNQVNLLAAGSGNKVYIWNVATGDFFGILDGHKDLVTSVTFSPVEGILASASCDKTIRLWDLDDGSELDQYKGHSDEISSISFSPNGDLLASGSSDSTVRIWEVSSSSQLFRLSGSMTYIDNISFSPDGSILAAASGDKIVIWNVIQGIEICVLKGHSENITSVAFSPDGKFLASGACDSTLCLWGVQ